MIWLLEITFARQAWRFASGPAAVEVDGYLYEGGLSVSSVLIEAAVFSGPSERQGAALTIASWPGDMPLGKLVAKGNRLIRCEAKLSLYQAGTGKVLPVMKGKIDNPKIGRGGEPHTMMLEASSYEDQALVPSLRQVITEETWPNAHEEALGYAYPIPFGTPGAYRDGNGVDRVTAGQRARVVEWVEPPEVYNPDTGEGNAYASVRVATLFHLLHADVFSGTGTSYICQGSEEAGPIIDGVRLTVGDRILVRFDNAIRSEHFTSLSAGTLEYQNGIFVVGKRDDGTGTNLWYLSAADDFALDVDMVLNRRVYVEEGRVCGGRWFNLVELGAISTGSPARYENRWEEDAATYGAQKLLASAYEVEAGQVRGFSDADVQRGAASFVTGNYRRIPLVDAYDGLGQPVVLVDLASLELTTTLVSGAGGVSNVDYPVYSVDGESTTGARPAEWRTGTSYHLAWDEGPALVMENGKPALHVGDIIRWVLSKSSVEVDQARLRTSAPLLERFLVSGVIDEHSPPAQLVADRWIDMVPAALSTGPNGLRLDVARLDEQARVRLTVGEDCEIVDAWTQTYLRREGPLNSFGLSYAKSEISGRPKLRLALGAGNDHDLADANARASMLHAGESAESHESWDVWSFASAAAWGRWEMRAYALPVLRAQIWIPDESPLERLDIAGAPLLLTDDAMGLDSVVGMVEAVQVDPGQFGAVVTAILWDPARV